MVPLTDERDVDTLRQISQLLDRENQRLIEKIRELTAELARLRGTPHAEQLALALREDLARARAQILEHRADADTPPPPTRAPQPGHGPRPQPQLPNVAYRHELPPDQQTCPACRGTLTAIPDQYETAERISTVTLTYQIERHHRQKYRCACNGAVVTAPAPSRADPRRPLCAGLCGGRGRRERRGSSALGAPSTHDGARGPLVVDSQTLCDQLNALARHLGPTYEALGRQALAAPVIHADETRWPILGTTKSSAGTVWTVRTPTVAYYRILPGKSAEEGRQVLDGYRGTAVVDGFAVYEVLARAGPGLTLAHCWAHVLRKYDEIADQWPVACDTIRALIGELYAIDRLVPGPFPGDADAQALRQQLRRDRAQPVLDQIWQWATGQAGLPRSDFGKAVRYMLERWDGLTRFVHDPRISLDNNAAERALGGPVVGRKNHYGSRSLRGTQVAALFYTLCETAHLVGVDPHAYLLHAVNAALATPGTVTLPDALLPHA